MTEDEFDRGHELLGRLREIENARERWNRAEFVTALADMLGVDGKLRGEIYVQPERVFTIPLVADFRRVVFERLDAEERQLRQEFAQL